MAETTKTNKKTAKKVTSTKKTAPKTTPKTTSESKGLLAVFATGGKQYLVEVGTKIKIEKIPGKHEEGEALVFDKVLLTTDGGSKTVIGMPFIAGAKVTATLNKVARYKTVNVIKYKAKSRYFKKYGHRQPYFEIQIDSLN